MKLSEDMRKKLVDEYRYIVEKMRETDDAFFKVYLYSGAYGITFRIFNFEYDPQLIFIHHMLQVSYNTINARLNMMKKGDTSIVLGKEFFDELTNRLEELANSIEEDNSTHEILEKLSGMMYFTTGNGYYLSLKGIKLF